MLTALALAVSLSAPEPGRFPTLTADEVREWTSGGYDALLVDARSPEEFAAAHIPKAVNIPPDRVRAEPARLPRSKAAVVIFYCRGPG